MNKIMTVKIVGGIMQIKKNDSFLNALYEGRLVGDIKLANRLTFIEHCSKFNIFSWNGSTRMSYYKTCFNK